MDPESDEYTTWNRNALCGKLIQLGVKPADLWYSEDFTSEAADAADICFECPIRKLCLEKACTNKEAFGIWGGLPPTARHKRGRSNNFTKLVNEPNPYQTEDTESPFYSDNLGEES